MKARGREVYIITGVVVVVLAAAWYFLLFNPQRQELAQLDEQVASARVTLATAQQQLVRLQEYEKTAPQARVEVVKLGKMMPEGEGQPSLIVELTKTAELAGVTINSIARGTVESGQPFGIQTVTLSVTGTYFDMVDFMYRVEDYVAVRNEQVRATGRLLQIASLQMATQGAATDGTTSDPMLNITMEINGYLWGGGTGSGAPATTPAATAGTGETTVAQTEGGAK